MHLKHEIVLTGYLACHTNDLIILWLRDISWDHFITVLQNDR